MKVEEILFTEEQINKKVIEIAKELDKHFNGEQITFICILKGSYMFFSDLLKNIDSDVRIDFMQVSSYGSSTVSSGKLKIKKDLDIDLENKNVVIVEDIIDTGITLYNLKKYLLEKNPKELKICAFLDKFERRIADIEADYIGYKIPDKFVVGYGLDFNEEYRNLPYIGVLGDE